MTHVDRYFAAGLLVTLLVGGAFVVYRGGWLPDEPDPADPLRAQLESVDLQMVLSDLRALGNERTLGDPDAPVEVVEISDYQCSACGAVHEATQEMLDFFVEGGDVKASVFSISLPGHDAAALAAMVAGCVYKAEAAVYPAYRDLLFLHRERWSTAEAPGEMLASLVEDVGLEREVIDQCVSADPGTRARIEGSFDRISAEGLSFVPLLLVDGEPILASTAEGIRDALVRKIVERLEMKR